jgi:pyrroline-5-carboxylate reductase
MRGSAKAGQMKIGVIGAGRFGRAFISGCLNSRIVSRKKMWAAARSENNRNALRKTGIRAVADFTNLISNTEILVLSVKPFQISEVLAKIREKKISPSALIISVAAGTSIEKIERELATKNPVIRAMPNSPCNVQSGFTAICGGSYVKQRHFTLARKIFETLGKARVVEEKYFDWITALSGSGPAYFYTFMQCMIDQAVAAGISHEQATELVAQTALGAARMVELSERSPSDLLKDVATPGGCTIQALQILEQGEISKIFSFAMLRAARVAAELGRASS